MQIFTKISNLPYLALAVATMSVLDAQQARAQEAENIGGIADVVSEQVGNLGTMALSVMFLGGVFFVGAGLMKLKQAADDGGRQVKYGDGLWRLGVGAGLVAVPAMTGILTASLGLGDGGPSSAAAPF